MADFPITRPESITPTSNTGGHDSPPGDTRQPRRHRPSPEPAAPNLPEDIHEDEANHQVDELA